jgi:hypothetical protein
MIGGAGKLKVVVRSSKTAIKSVFDKNDHITMMVTISAAGFKFIPFIIIKRKTCPNVLKDLIEHETMVLGGQSFGWMTRIIHYVDIIQVITFPSHTIHLLQPLEVGVFSSFKASLRQYNSRYSKLQINSPDTKFTDSGKIF